MKYRADPKDREIALKYVKALNDRMIAESFYEALVTKVKHDLACEQTHWVIANATIISNEPDPDDVVFQAVALPDASHYQAEGIDPADLGLAGPREEGDCERCGTPCASWAKHMICPVCGDQVYGTEGREWRRWSRLCLRGELSFLPPFEPLATLAI